MRIAVLGTGMVGRAHVARLDSLGHDVVVGTRDPDATMRRTDADRMGNPPLRRWLEDQSLDVELATFADALVGADLVLNALHGEVAPGVLGQLDPAVLDGTVVLDVSNPLEFTEDGPQVVVDDDGSLGERIQRAVPGARVVKTLNTVTAAVMVDPASVGDGAHTVFVSGDDQDAKQRATALLREYGWSDIVDLGDITTARGTEMYLALWLRVAGALGDPHFNVRVVRGDP